VRGCPQFLSSTWLASASSATAGSPPICATKPASRPTFAASPSPSSTVDRPGIPTSPTGHASRSPSSAATPATTSGRSTGPTATAAGTATTTSTPVPPTNSSMRSPKTPLHLLGMTYAHSADDRFLHHGAGRHLRRLHIDLSKRVRQHSCQSLWDRPTSVAPAEDVQPLRSRSLDHRPCPRRIPAANGPDGSAAWGSLAVSPRRRCSRRSSGRSRASIHLAG
jgi:hypothetical protein